MENRVKNFFQQGRKAERVYDVVFDMEYYITLKLMLSCGFSTIFGFKPMIWLHYKCKYFIGMDREEWLHLMGYKEYISNVLSQREFLNSLNMIDNGSERSVKYTFQYKYGNYRLIVQQGNCKIKIDMEAWESLMRTRIFLTTILCWNSILRKQILHFYYDYYIPTCCRLKKTNIQLNEINGITEKDIEIDLTRLCYEIGKKMQSKIVTDIKMHRLLLGMDNK